MMQNAGVLYILTCKCAWRHSGVPFFDNFSTSALQKVARECQFFTILTWKCASRYSGVQFFHIATSKSGPRMLCFVHFDLQMYLSLQRRAIFRHRNFKKWSEPLSFLTFWLENVLLATAACNFSTSQLQKVVRAPQFFDILTSKCASRYSGVQFFLCPLQSYLRTRRFSEITFRPSRHTKHWKTQHFATSLTFRACWSSFFPHLLIFFLAALLFQLSILSEVRLLNFLRSYHDVFKCESEKDIDRENALHLDIIYWFHRLWIGIWTVAQHCVTGRNFSFGLCALAVHLRFRCTSAAWIV